MRDRGGGEESQMEKNALIITTFWVKTLGHFSNNLFCLQSRGFKSAHHYLVHLRERWDQEDQEDSAKSEAVEANDEVEED